MRPRGKLLLLLLLLLFYNFSSYAKRKRVKMSLADVSRILATRHRDTKHDHSLHMIISNYIQVQPAVTVTTWPKTKGPHSQKGEQWAVYR